MTKKYIFLKILPRGRSIGHWGWSSYDLRTWSSHVLKIGKSKIVDWGNNRCGTKPKYSQYIIEWTNSFHKNKCMHLRYFHFCWNWKVPVVTKLIYSWICLSLHLKVLWHQNCSAWSYFWDKKYFEYYTIRLYWICKKGKYVSK